MINLSCLLDAEKPLADARAQLPTAGQSPAAFLDCSSRSAVLCSAQLPARWISLYYTEMDLRPLVYELTSVAVACLRSGRPLAGAPAPASLDLPGRRMTIDFLHWMYSPLKRLLLPTLSLPPASSRINTRAHRSFLERGRGRGHFRRKAFRRTCHGTDLTSG